MPYGKMKMTAVHSDVTFVEGPLSNWTIVGDAQGFSLIDAGYRRDAKLVVESLRRVGIALTDVRRIFVTHGHVDHIGSIPSLLELNPELEIITAAQEIDNVRGPERSQVSVHDFGLRILEPLTLKWAIAAIASGGLQSLEISHVRTWVPGDLTSVIPVLTPGHTAGSTCYLIADSDVIVTGDALVTGHPINWRKQNVQPRAVPAVFSTVPRDAEITALQMRLPSIVLPGHGPAVRHTAMGWRRL